MNFVNPWFLHNIRCIIIINYSKSSFIHNDFFLISAFVVFSSSDCHMLKLRDGRDHASADPCRILPVDVEYKLKVIVYVWIKLAEFLFNPLSEAYIRIDIIRLL